MTIQELRERQAWPLEQKIDHSLATIETFVSHWGGVKQCYISLSCGKDSTVLYHLAKRLYPNILAVFAQTFCEWPEIIQFCNKLRKDPKNNIRVVKAKITPKQVWAKYGFPLVGKETAEKIHMIRYNPNSETAKKWLQPKGYFTLPMKWRYLLDVPYNCGSNCCDKLKKEPFYRFQKETGLHPILGTMAAESQLRTGQYLRNGGCNVFGKNSKSMPLSIWTEEDIWAYIERYNVEIADIYYKGVRRTGCVPCAFSTCFKSEDKFDVLYKLHPKYYDMIMKYENNGVPYRVALREMFARCGKTLPDERENNLFDTNDVL